MANTGASSFKQKLGALQKLNVVSSVESDYLFTLEKEFSATVAGVFSAIGCLAKGYITGQFAPEEGFALQDRSGSLLKYHESSFFPGWSPRQFSLSGAILEYRNLKKPSTSATLIQLTPECFCTETTLSAAQKKHGFILVTPNKVLQICCENFSDKMAWISSLARAMLIPRRGTGISRSVLFQGELGPPLSTNPDIDAKVMTGGVVECETIKLAHGKKTPQLRYMALQVHFLSFWKNEYAYTSGNRPVDYIFLEHSMKILNRTPSTLELRLISPTLPGDDVYYIEFSSPVKCDAWKQMLISSQECSRRILREYESFFRASQRASLRNSKPPRPIPQPKENEPSPAQRPAANESPTEVGPQGSVEHLLPPPLPPREDTPPAASTIIDTPLAPPKSTESDVDIFPELDPRPRIELKLRKKMDDDNTDAAINVVDEKLGYIHANYTDALVCVRDEIFTQLSPDDIPMRFWFLRPPNSLSVEMGADSSKFSTLPASQEEETLLESCLVDGTYLLLFSPNELIKASDDWEAERRAYQQEITHLEAQLAEARRALHERAKLLKLSSEENELSPLATALASLQRDGFLDSSILIPDLEYEYLCVFNEDDALRAFAFSPSCPLRVVWRKLCADPKKMRKYIEDLEMFVLRRYKIRKERLGAAFWLHNVLRDARFMNDSSLFESWAKNEPWCEDDAERYVYLSSKLFYVSENADEFSILMKPVPTEPPVRGEKGQRGSTLTKQELFKSNRPKSFLASNDAQEAMKKFQERRSKSIRALTAATGQKEQGTVDKPDIPVQKPDTNVDTNTTKPVEAASTNEVTTTDVKEQQTQGNEVETNLRQAGNAVSKQEDSISTISVVASDSQPDDATDKVKGATSGKEELSNKHALSAEAASNDAEKEADNGANAPHKETESSEVDEDSSKSESDESDDDSNSDEEDIRLLGEHEEEKSEIPPPPKFSDHANYAQENSDDNLL